MRFIALALVAGLSSAAHARGPATVAIPVLAHPVARGEVVAAGDFEIRQMPPAQANGILTPTDAAGREAVRSLAAGMPVRAPDLVTPRLVRRGEPVTIAWRSGGLSITTSGRALSSGGSGDVVRVVAETTNRTIDAVVEGSGAVAIRAQ